MGLLSVCGTFPGQVMFHNTSLGCPQGNVVLLVSCVASHFIFSKFFFCGDFVFFVQFSHNYAHNSVSEVDMVGHSLSLVRIFVSCLISIKMITVVPCNSQIDFFRTWPAFSNKTQKLFCLYDAKVLHNSQNCTIRRNQLQKQIRTEQGRLWHLSKRVKFSRHLVGSFSFPYTWSKNVHLYVLFRAISQSQKQIYIYIMFQSTFSSHVYVQLKLPSGQFKHQT